MRLAGTYSAFARFLLPILRGRQHNHDDGAAHTIRHPHSMDICPLALRRGSDGLLRTSKSTELHVTHHGLTCLSL